MACGSRINTNNICLLTFDIFSFGRTDLCYSELFLKAISRAMKSASKVKIGQIVHHMVLSSSDRGTCDISIMLSAIADQNLFGMQILDFKPL